MNVELIEEPWIRDNRIRCLNIPTYSLHGGSGRLWAAIMINGVDSWLIPEFCGYVVAVEIKLQEDGVRRRLLVASVYLLGDRTIFSPSKEMVESVDYCRSRNLELVVGCYQLSQ